MARPLKVHWKSGKTPSRRCHECRDLFAVCYSRCPNVQLRSVLAWKPLRDGGASGVPETGSGTGRRSQKKERRGAILTP